MVAEAARQDNRFPANIRIGLNNLSRADLRCAELYAANLSHADLTGAYVAGAELDHANLSGAKLDGLQRTCPCRAED